MGRPSKYTPELIGQICARLSKGEPMAAICRDEGMPDPSTVWDWQQSKPEVSQAIARARELGFDAIAANTRLIARGQGESTADVQRDKLIIDTDLKLLAKWDPKRYGDKVTLAGDAENPLALAVSDARAKLAKRLGKHPDEL